MKKILAFALCLCLLLTPVFASAKEIKDENSSYMTNLLDKKWNVKTSSIHPELRVVGNLVRIVMPQFTEGFFKLANFFMDNFICGINLAKSVNFEEKYIEREDGSSLRICVYSPKERKENVPGLLWMHGGGYGLGAPEQDYKFIESFVESSGCVLVAPDYINSTSASYPAALNDCYLALEWLRDNVESYGMRSDQIFVGGNSAGGGLCAALTLLARDKGEINIAFQMPLYPMIDDRMITPSSQNNDAPIWNTKSNEVGWRLYLGELYQTDKVPKYAAPARETDYSNLPPTLTYVGDIEPFTDETLIYIKNLEDAGVKVNYKIFEGCFHGFDLFSFTTPAKQAKQFLIDGFMFAVENYTAEQK